MSFGFKNTSQRRIIYSLDKDMAQMMENINKNSKLFLHIVFVFVAVVVSSSSSSSCVFEDKMED